MKARVPNGLLMMVQEARNVFANQGAVRQPNVHVHRFVTLQEMTEGVKRGE